MTTPFTQEITAAASRHGLPPDLVTAIVAVESAGNPWAWNPEPRYRYYWDVRTNTFFRAPSPQELASERPPADFRALGGDPDQEWWAQAASWGLMQVMGAVAREYGFEAPYLTKLLDPLPNLEYGCRHLARLRNRYLRQHGWDGVIAAYNAGSPRKSEAGLWGNQPYVDKVRKLFGD